MSDAPQLPQSISNDGREVWDWADSFSKHIHRQDEARRLSVDLFRVGRRCGDCDNWMKSSQCPQERNVNGRNHGPSCEGTICAAFKITNQAIARKIELTERLKALKATTQP